MKTISKLLEITIVLILFFASCKKKNNEPNVDEPIPINDVPEVITTLRISLVDSADVNQTSFNYSFKDPDGDGGQAGYFLNESGTLDTIMLIANHTYYSKVYILDESKTPTDSISNIIAGEESSEHMLFYNGDPSASGNSSNTIINTVVPYIIKTNGSNITIMYNDLDNGTPQRNIGLQTKWRTSNSTNGNVYPIIIALKHQPGVKDGSYLPGETDVMVEFKVKVN